MNTLCEPGGGKGAGNSNISRRTEVTFIVQLDLEPSSCWNPQGREDYPWQPQEEGMWEMLGRELFGII